MSILKKTWSIVDIKLESHIMNVRFWGTRGSIAVPGKETIMYGGNTTCLEMTLESGKKIIVDAGTGIRALGNKLLAGKDKDKPGFEQIKKAAIKAIKGVLAEIKKNYEIEMHITCIIAGVGTVSTFEFLKSEIEAEEEGEETEGAETIGQKFVLVGKVESSCRRIEEATYRLAVAIQ